MGRHRAQLTHAERIGEAVAGPVLALILSTRGLARRARIYLALRFGLELTRPSDVVRERAAAAFTYSVLAAVPASGLAAIVFCWSLLLEHNNLPGGFS